MKLKLDDAACVGHGRCYALAPDVFEPDDHGHCVLVHEDVPPELEDGARAGVENCPESALSIEDD